MNAIPGLVGRDVELAELSTLLGAGGLVTLTGVGGVGKTTLARSLAADSSRRTSVVFVDLAAIEESSAVEPTIAAALGQGRFEAITASSVPDDVLVIVDNCEHVIDTAAAAIAELRTALPGIAICATSRIALGLRDEIILVVRPLGVPPRGVDDPDAPAVEMFRSIAARGGGELTDADLAAVCELCRRIDGVPLAIEIAATRTRSMSVGEILERLGDRLDTVGQGGFRRDVRQRSVRDTVEWSYHLLDPAEQRLFDRVGVHPGRFSASTAHAVADDDGSIDDTLDRLDRLVAASLLVPNRSMDGSTWYHQLRVVRACALDHLDASGERDAATERFVDQMVAEARRLAAGAERGGTAWSVAMMVSLLDGFLFAVRWATEHDDDPRRALGIMPVLWGHQSRTDDVLATAQRVLDRWPSPGGDGWADAAAVAATCLWIVDDHDGAERMVERALPVAGDAVWAPVLLRRVDGLLAWSRGDTPRALAVFAETADHARLLGLAWFLADAELLLASVLTSSGDTESALAITRRIKGLGPEQVLSVALAMSIESDVLLDLDPAEALEVADGGRDVARSTGFAAAVVGFARTTAIAHALGGDLATAAVDLKEGLDIVLRSGGPPRAVLEAAAVLAHRSGDEAWLELADAAAACDPAAHVLLQSASRFLPSQPAGTAPTMDLAGALAATEHLLSRLDGDGRSPTNDGAPARAPERPASAPAMGSSGQPAASGNRWRRHGDHWELDFADQTVSVRHSKGMDDLARLLDAPHTEIPAIDLADAAVTSSDTGEMLDSTARRQYENKIRELQVDLVEAEDDNDVGRVELITAELDVLVEQLTAAVGLGRRSRRAGATNDRARTAVTRRIRKAIAHVLDLHPPLGRHLDASIRTGTYCAYRPEHRTSWEVTRQRAATDSSASAGSTSASATIGEPGR